LVAEAVQALAKEGATASSSLDDFVDKLASPRAVWLMVPAAAVDSSLADLAARLSPDDVIIDGGNSYYIDDIRRAGELKSKGIHYAGAGARPCGSHARTRERYAESKCH
jgi:6-phosphogluconate dehydrogenase